MSRELSIQVLEALDFSALGEIYCDYGGEAFWESRYETVIELGASWAEALRARLGRGGRSLYVGAGVAELSALLTEAYTLEREVVVANLREAECQLLNAALLEVGLDRVSFEAIDAVAAVSRGPFDHISVVSVLCDPEEYPVTSGVTYGRIPPVLLDLDAFSTERDRLVETVAAVLGAMRLPGMVTTTVEELSWIMHWAAAQGVTVEVDDETVETAVVGDPIGFVRLNS